MAPASKRKTGVQSSSSSSSAGSKDSWIARRQEKKRAVSSPDQMTPKSVPVPIMSKELTALRDVYDKLWNLAWDPHEILGRDEQLAIVSSFLEDGLKQPTGGALYICGSPGTGKSLSVDYLTRSLLQEHKNDLIRPAVLYANAMNLTDPRTIYPFLAKLLAESKVTLPEESVLNNKITVKKMSPLDAANALQALFLPKQLTRHTKGKIILVIDEMDGLLSSHNQEVLYRLFEWGYKANSRLLLIGIANRVDLTERFLPVLHQRGCAPKVLLYPAYSYEHLLLITKQRTTLEGIDECSLFDARSLELLARKVASKSGDVRQCLSICKLCLEEVNLSVEGMSNEDAIALFDKLKHTPLVGIGLMARTLNQRLGSPTMRVVKGLPTFQQVVLCVLSMVMQHKHTSSLTVSTFRRYFVWVLQHLPGLPKVKNAEFQDIVMMLRGSGMVTLTNPKSKRANNDTFQEYLILTLTVKHDDVSYALKALDEDEDGYFHGLFSRAAHLKWKRCT